MHTPAAGDLTIFGDCGQVLPSSCLSPPAAPAANPIKWLRCLLLQIGKSWGMALGRGPAHTRHPCQLQLCCGFHPLSHISMSTSCTQPVLALMVSILALEPGELLKRFSSHSTCCVIDQLTRATQDAVGAFFFGQQHVCLGMLKYPRSYKQL